MKSVELSPLAEVALQMYLAEAGRLDYKPDFEQRRSLMEDAYRVAAEFLEVGESFRVDPDEAGTADGLLTESEIEMVNRRADEGFGFIPVRLHAVMGSLSTLFPDVYKAVMEAGFSTAMGDEEIPELYRFLRGEFKR